MIKRLISLAALVTVIAVVFPSSSALAGSDACGLGGLTNLNIVLKYSPGTDKVGIVTHGVGSQLTIESCDSQCPLGKFTFNDHNVGGIQYLTIKDEHGNCIMDTGDNSAIVMANGCDSSAADQLWQPTPVGVNGCIFESDRTGLDMITTSDNPGVKVWDGQLGGGHWATWCFSVNC